MLSESEEKGRNELVDTTLNGVLVMLVNFFSLGE